MDLFTPDAPWTTAANGVRVFELYGEWLGRDATDEQVRQVVADLNRRGIAIALAGGALAPVDCAGDVEGFAGISEAVRISTAHFAMQGWDRLLLCLRSCLRRRHR